MLVERMQDEVAYGRGMGKIHVDDGFWGESRREKNVFLA